MRRHLGYSPEEADALPWWQHRLFLEGIQEELTGEKPVSSVPQDIPLESLGLSVRRA